MTVSSQVKQTLASLKGARAAIETFLVFEQNPQVKDVYERNLDRLNRVISDFESRVEVLEYQEPQYKGL